MWQKHNIINTPDLLQKLDDFVTKQKPTLIAVDTETNGLSFTRNVVVGVSLSVDSEMGFYIPLLDWFPNTEITKSSKKTGLTYPEGCFKDVWKEAYYEEGVKPGWYKPPGFIKAYLKKWLLDSNAEIIMHNAPFDVLMIEGTFGLDLTDKVWCDTALLKHVIDENTPHGLKETAVRWADKIGFDTEADKEQQEMGVSVIKNGGKFLKRDKWIWRASPDVMAKYAAQDTILTYALYEEGLRRLTTEYEEKHLDWFFRDEVMPLCREVVIPMKRQGAYIDVPYFKEMEQEVENKLEALEESMFAEISDYLSDFPLGSPVNDIVSLKKLVLEIVKRDRLEMPLAKGKVTFAKSAIKAQFEKTGHWVWGWYLGENDPILSPTELEKLKTDIYYQEMGHRYVFNFKSDKHIRWLLFSKLGLSTGDFPVTEGGDVSVNAKALKTINKKFPFIRKILLYKKLSKQLGTYIKPALKLQDDGWLRMDFKQNGTTSGRFACSGGYNLQTLPKVEELDRCPQCEAKAPTVTQTMKILADLHCSKCGYTEEDIFTPSAIKKGFIAPPGWKIINADFSSLEPRCVHPESIVRVDAGVKYIRDVVVGERIYTKDGFKEIKNKWESIKRQQILVTRKGCVRTSYEHKVFVKGKGFIEARDVEVGDELEGIGYPKDADILQIANKSVELPIYPKNIKNANLPLGHIKITEDLAWLVGAFLGDGVCSNISRRYKFGGASKYVGICGLVQDGVIERFSQILKNYGFSNSVSKDKRSQGMSTCVFNDAWLVSIFENSLKVLDTHRRLRVPLWIFNAPKDLKLSFLAGLIDTDGTYNKKKSELSISSKSIDFLTDCLLLAQTLGLDTGKIGVTHKQIKGNYFRNYQLRFTTKSVNRLVTLGLEEFQTVERKKVRSLRNALNTDERFVVLEKLDGEEVTMVDITVDGNEEFGCNGIRVHNCFAENSADPKLKAVYLQNLDLYSKVYCDMEDREGQYSPDPKESNFLKKLAPEKRTMVKPVVLGIPYGARDWQTAVLMNFKKKVFKNGVEVEVVDVERGAEFRRLYLDTYPELQKYMLKQELNAIEHGFTETVIGRRRHFRWTKEVGKLLAKAGIPYEDFVDCPKRELRTFHLNDVMNHNALKKLILKNGMSLFDVKKKQTRQWDFVHALFVNELNNAKNFPIQGMAAHIANRSMLELARYYKKQNINAVIILQVHDEITALAKEKEVEIASEYHRLAMEKNEYTKLISIPMEADPIVCDNLKDSK